MPCDHTYTKQIALFISLAFLAPAIATAPLIMAPSLMPCIKLLMFQTIFSQDDYDEEELTFDLIAVDVNTIN